MEKIRPLERCISERVSTHFSADPFGSATGQHMNFGNDFGSAASIGPFLLSKSVVSEFRFSHAPSVVQVERSIPLRATVCTVVEPLFPDSGSSFFPLLRSSRI